MGRYSREKKAKTATVPRGWTAAEWEAEQESWLDEREGPWLWSEFYALKNEKGMELEWVDRGFLVDILCDMHPWQVVVKCTQVGLSTIQIFKTHYAAQIKGFGVIYTLPTYKLLTEFGKTKIEPLMNNNPSLKPTGAETLGAHTYSTGGYVLFRGTMGDAQDISHSADIIVSDETDRSDLTVVEGLESRLMASTYKGQWWFTNPTRPGVGTDNKWAISDKREWKVVCPRCGVEQELDFWQNVSSEKYFSEEEEEEKERHYFHCSSCNEEWKDDKSIRRMGRWVATDPGKKWHGYHISQMMAPWISAEELVEAYRTKTKEYFYNYILGKPVIGEGISVDKSLILANRVPDKDERRKTVGTTKFMGVDVGSSLHVSIGDERGITKLACLSGKDKWESLEKLMLLEQIHLCVIDNLPTEGQVAFQKKFPYKVLRCIYDYKDKRKEDYEVKRDVGVVNVHKTRAIDAILADFANGQLPLFLEADDPYLDHDNATGNALAPHWASMYQVGLDGADENIVKKDRMGNVIRTWENAGPDHFAHSNIYWFIARAIGYVAHDTGSFMAGDLRTRRAPRMEEEDEEEEERVGFFQ